MTAGDAKPGQDQQGSGTTPTVFDDFAGNHFVAIADNADPYIHVNVYNRKTGRLVARRPCSATPLAGNTENSLIAVNHSILVENNYGNRNRASTLGRRTTHPGDTGRLRPHDGQIPCRLGQHQDRGPLRRLAALDRRRIGYTYGKDPGAGTVRPGVPDRAIVPSRTSPVEIAGRRPGEQLSTGG